MNIKKGSEYQEKARLQFSAEKTLKKKEDGFHCFCFCQPTISHEMMGHFIE